MVSPGVERYSTEETSCPIRHKLGHGFRTESNIISKRGALKCETPQPS